MPAPLSQRLHKALALLLLLLGPAAVLAFSFSSYLHPTRARTPQQCSPTALAASMQQPQQQQQPQKTTTTKAAVGAASRRDWLLAQSVSVFVPASLGLLGLTGAAGAAADPAKAGTKDDPAYQKCLSNCMYFCTKPKGEAQRSRAECLPGCKEKCAQTKAQTMIGKPKE